MAAFWMKLDLARTVKGHLGKFEQQPPVGVPAFSLNMPGHFLLTIHLTSWLQGCTSESLALKVCSCAGDLGHTVTCCRAPAWSPTPILCLLKVELWNVEDVAYQPDFSLQHLDLISQDDQGCWGQEGQRRHRDTPGTGYSEDRLHPPCRVEHKQCLLAFLVSLGPLSQVVSFQSFTSWHICH